MIQSHFHQLLSSNLDIEEAQLLELLGHCNLKTYSKGSFLLRSGEKAADIFYVEIGLLRYYSIDEKGKDHILQFAPEGWFVSDRDSMYNNSPSKYFIDAIEDTTVLFLNNDFLVDLAKENEAFIELNNRLLHNHVRHLQNRINSLLSHSAEERYLDFVRMYPDILLRVPQTMVASFLGITPESLSRVRKELARKNQRQKK